MLISSSAKPRDEGVILGRVDVEVDLAGSRGFVVDERGEGESGDEDGLSDDVAPAVGAEERDLTWPKGRRDVVLGPRGGRWFQPATWMKL